MEASDHSDSGGEEDASEDEEPGWLKMYEEARGRMGTKELLKAIAANKGVAVERGIPQYVYLAVVSGHSDVGPFAPTITTNESDRGNYLIKIGTTKKYLPLRWKELPYEAGVRSSAAKPAIIQVLAVLRRGSEVLEKQTKVKMRDYGMEAETPVSNHFNEKTSKEYFQYSVENVVKAIGALYSTCKQNKLVNSLYVSERPTRFNSKKSVFVPTSHASYELKVGDTLPPFHYLKFDGFKDIEDCEALPVWNGALVLGLMLHDRGGRGHILNMMDSEEEEEDEEEVVKIEVEGYEPPGGGKYWSYELSKRLKAKPNRMLGEGRWYVTLSGFTFITKDVTRTTFNSIKEKGDDEGEEEEAAGEGGGEEDGNPKRQRRSLWAWLPWSNASTKTFTPLPSLHRLRIS